MIYPYKCSRCGAGYDRVCSLDEYERNPGIPCLCGADMGRVITAPRVLLHTKPFEPFKSPVDGSIVSSRRELQEHNKRNSVVNTHDGYDEQTILGWTQKDYQKPLDEERKKDLKDDMRKAVQKLEEGYTPHPASEDEIIP
jgi:DNA-directed RNA polymerase subunit RPC12/RpoP